MAAGTDSWLKKDARPVISDKYNDFQHCIEWSLNILDIQILFPKSLIIIMLSNQHFSIYPDLHYGATT